MWTQPEYDIVINALGVDATFHQTKTLTAVKMRVGFAAVSKENEVIVNSLGTAAKVITLKQSAMTGIVPVKFDTITINTNEKYTIDSISPVHLPVSSTVIGYRCYCKGF
jgi:cytochrome c biogenesis factor